MMWIFMHGIPLEKTYHTPGISKYNDKTHLESFVKTHHI